MPDLLNLFLGLSLGAAAALAANAQAVALAKLVLFAAIISIGGWVWETIYCSIVEKRLVRRGFLFGPACPIYGVGAASVRLVLGWSNDVVFVFLAGAALATAIEYVTADILWRRYKRRWWEYDSMPLNYKGRICAPASTVFGLFSLASVFVLGPAFDAGIECVAATDLMALATAALAVFSADLLASMAWLDDARRARAQLLASRLRARLG